ncbi:tyrosyl-tRNA synthetase [mine drainage metagenome]|uniref:tyrosine--tRNA ligase n=1 Tax=mine drainage metagenome TaxID=410659 RepID=T1A0V8_9ZZZZ
MSKSDPASGIPMPVDPEVLRARIAGAFCPAQVADGNPVVEAVRYIVFPWDGRLEVDRPAKFGGPLVFASEAEFRAAWTAGGLHPQDLKAAVAAALNRRLEPVRAYFAAHPDLGPASFQAPPAPPTAG